MERSVSARSGWALLMVAALAGCGYGGSSNDPSQAPDTTPITAVLDTAAATTGYQVTAFTSSAASFVWSGPNCGSHHDTATGGTNPTSTMIWSHPHPPCAGSPDQQDATIQVDVVVNGYATTCTYRGAASGTGPACVKKSGQYQKY